MKVTVASGHGLEKKLTVEVEADVVTKKLNEIASDLARKVNIPGGYRKFKAKVSRVKQMFRKDIAGQAAQALLEESLPGAVEQQDFKTIGMPQLSDMGSPTAGKPFEYTFVVETQPVLDNLNYRGMVVGVSPSDVSNEEVDERLELLQRQATQLVEATSKTIQDGHHLQLAVKASTADEELREKLEQTAMLELDDGAEDVVREALIGKALDASGTLEAKPSAFHLGAGPEHADTVFTWSYEVTKVMEKKVPEINDEFAMETKGLKSLLALRGELREEAQKEKVSLTQRKARYLLTQQLMEANRFDLPANFIRAIFEDKMKKYRETMEQYGGLDEQMLQQIIASRQDEELDSSARQTAEFLIVNAIAEAENIEISDEQVEQKLAEMAEEQGVQVEFLKGKMSEDEQANLKNGLKVDAVYRIVESHGVQRDLEDYVNHRAYQRKIVALVGRNRWTSKRNRSASLRQRHAA